MGTAWKPLSEYEMCSHSMKPHITQWLCFMWHQLILRLTHRSWTTIVIFIIPFWLECLTYYSDKISSIKKTSILAISSNCLRVLWSNVVLYFNQIDKHIAFLLVVFLRISSPPPPPVLPPLNTSVRIYELTYLKFSPKCRKSPNEALSTVIFHLHRLANLYLTWHWTSTLQLTRLSGKIIKTQKPSDTN